ncbi:NHLP family bacteriocin export ABC transporter peptidase/permease/ATPase subunit [Nostoc sp.]|uniref:NHLP family bacteriocin export ABC transporter peptidase/permease/ATPase subunit n=1 Tax=Nostoc sp. TaxID=1180 RepID=UPI002FF6DD43
MTQFLSRIRSRWNRFGFDTSRTPTLIQMENAECGAAALGIILAYYQRIVPLSELRRECGVSRDGSKASNMVKAARLYGLEAKGFKLPIEKLVDVRFPCIVFWNFNHFLVVERFTQNWVYLNDPASGRRKVSQEEFSQSYTGIVLVLEPGSEFKPGGKKPGILSALIGRLKHSQQAIAFCLIAGLLLTLPRLAIPVFSQVFVDEVLVQGRQEWIRPLLIAMIVTALFQGLLAQMRLNYLLRLSIKLSTTMAGNFLWHILRLPVSFYAQRYAGEISNRSALNDKVSGVITGQLGTTAIDLVMIVFYAVIMFAYDWVLTLVAITFAILNLVLLRFLATSRKDANSKLAQEGGKALGMVVGSLLSIESVKASGLESDVFAKFAGSYAKTINAQKEAVVPNQMLSTLPILLGAMATTTILVVGGFRIMGGSLSIGMLMAYQSLTQGFLGPVNSLLNFGTTLQDLEADLNRLDDVLQNPVDPTVTRERSFASTPQATAQNIRLKGTVELSHLTFGYSRLAAPLIDDFSLTVHPGQRVALVGGSGSGKSTVAKLVTGLYQPWQGEIRLDGIEYTRIPRTVLANSLAMVEQEIFLFAGTVRENLTLWDATVPLEDLVRACQDAAIHDLIISMPGGYESSLIEGGMNLSGGQRQRLEIARALVWNPSILVLDEATSALDAETELIIDRNLRRRGCSCIVVAHRLSTIRDCDEIIVLNKGKVVQRGTHDELRQQPGTYQDLLSTATKTEEQENAIA